MPSKKQARDDTTSSKQKLTKPVTKNLDIVARQQTHPAAIIQDGVLPSLLTINDIQQLQRTIGNQAVGRLLVQKVQHKPDQKEVTIKQQLQPIVNRGHLIQREINRVYLAEDGTVRITRDARRPQGNLRGHTGDHTTPYLTFDHQIIAAVEGQDLPTAWNSLLTTFDEIRRMPGYGNSSYRDQFESLRTELHSWDGARIGVQEILDYGNRIIEVRNMLRYSAYQTRGHSTGGQNEAAARGLLEEERRIGRDRGTRYSADQIMYTMWDIFDHTRLARSVPADEKAIVLQQHRMSMLDTYWRVVKAYNITDASLERYYNDHYGYKHLK